MPVHERICQKKNNKKKKKKIKKCWFNVFFLCVLCVYEKNPEGTALHMACKHNNMEIFNCLMNCQTIGKSINAVDQVIHFKKKIKSI